VDSITQIPNFGAALSHGFQNRLWLIGLIVILEIGVFVIWLVLKKLEMELWAK
jgi:lipoprotein signal peptidase